MFINLKDVFKSLTLSPVERLDFQRREAARKLEMAKGTYDQGKISQAQTRYDLAARKYEIASGETITIRQ